MAREQIEALRKAMEGHEIALCVIPTADPHGSEYLGEHFMARKYLSGFTGSAGTLAVSADWAGLWTDGRYFLQAQKELSGSGIILYKSGEDGVPSLEEELALRLPERGVLAYDGTVVSRKFGQDMRRIAEEKKGGVCLLDLPEEVWEGRPAPTANPVFSLDLCYTGESRKEKLARIREQMKKEEANFHVITTLDDIAWITNLRGNDIACNPVFFSYLILSLEEAWLFVQDGVVPEAVREELLEDGLQLCSYDHFFEKLPLICGHKSVLADSRKVNEQAWNCLQAVCSMTDGPNPSASMKAVKNQVEIENIKKAHIKDGVAVTKFLCWLKKNIDSMPITETQAADRLETYRKEQEHYTGPSFPAICAAGANGALAHYQPLKEGAVLSPEGFFLVDSGGQYLEGTTDITRTVALGPLNGRQKKHFTAVLKGMLALGDAKFLQGCRGASLDYAAREPLWAMGLDYQHGTGHGVGYFLNVHEGPNAFRWKLPPEGPETAVLLPGMVTSDEPGVYLEGEYGIRTENLLLCRKAEKNQYGQFLEFEHLTLAPIDLEAVDWAEMDERDIKRLNAYHRQVQAALSPYLEGEELEWFLEAVGAV
ncbi:MAG: aminopeptidase P family protein [Lachnospiraceae bacterium]|nr:aminopeptidase P family protein [Lachnospiraceae bacterium]